jgi:hypothetical protein
MTENAAIVQTFGPYLTEDEAIAANPPPTGSGEENYRTKKIPSFLALIVGLSAAVLLILCCTMYAISHRRSRQYTTDKASKEATFWNNPAEEECGAFEAKNKVKQDHPNEPNASVSRQSPLYQYFYPLRAISDNEIIAAEKRTNGEFTSRMEDEYDHHNQDECESASVDSCNEMAIMDNPMPSSRRNSDVSGYLVSQGSSRGRVSSVTDFGVNLFGVHESESTKIQSRKASISSMMSLNGFSQHPPDNMNLSQTNTECSSEKGSNNGINMDNNGNEIVPGRRRGASMFEGRMFENRVHKSIDDDVSIDSSYVNNDVIAAANPLRSRESMKNRVKPNLRVSVNSGYSTTEFLVDNPQNVTRKSSVDMSRKNSVSYDLSVTGINHSNGIFVPDTENKHIEGSDSI